MIAVRGDRPSHRPRPARSDARWYVLAVVGAVIVIDAGRSRTLHRAAHRHSSAALGANALHFTLDLVGSVAVLIGLVLVRAGYPQADSIAALLVAGLVLYSAGRLMRSNVRVLMDSRLRRGRADRARGDRRHRGDRHAAVACACASRAGGTSSTWSSGVEPDAGLAHGHAVASAIEEAIEPRSARQRRGRARRARHGAGLAPRRHGPRAVLTLCLGPEHTLADARALRGRAGARDQGRAPGRDRRVRAYGSRLMLQVARRGVTDHCLNIGDQDVLPEHIVFAHRSTI